MSFSLVTFLSFFWYFLASTEIIPLAIAPVVNAAPNKMLTGIPTNVANVATLDIPVAMLIPLILECYNLFSGVELSMRSFFVIS